MRTYLHSEGKNYGPNADEVVSIALLLTNGPGTYPQWELWGPDCNRVTYHYEHDNPGRAYSDQIRLPLLRA